MKTYDVNIDMTWSTSRVVKAASAAEAKKKAWAKFSKRLPKRDFTITAEKL